MQRGEHEARPLSGYPITIVSEGFESPSDVHLPQRTRENEVVEPHRTANLGAGPSGREKGTFKSWSECIGRGVFKCPLGGKIARFEKREASYL